MSFATYWTLDCKAGITELANRLDVELSPHDHAELSRFSQWLHERSRRKKVNRAE